MKVLATHHLQTGVCASSKLACHTVVSHHVCQLVPHCPQHGRVSLAPQRCCEPARHSYRGQLTLARSSVSAEAKVQLGWSTGFQNKFSLGPVLGAGSFATVHQAIEKLNGDSYAVKVLCKDGKHGMQLDAISREVDTWLQAQEGSKYVAKLEGVYEDEEHAYIVQELCGGGDLKSLLEQKGCLSELETASIMRGVLDVLVECHRRHICYGDMKPANIMFNGDAESVPSAGSAPQPNVRAVDFGGSKVTSGGRSLTECCGTPLYMAPEMALQRYGLGVDVWAAGVMMYQMLTGRLPFWRNKSLQDIAKLPPYEIMAATRCNEVQFPRDLWADISLEAKDLVSRMLDRDPATRISAEDALDHPWLASVLRHVSATGAQPMVERLSPGRGSSNGIGALSPSRKLPSLTRRMSAELPPNSLLPDLLRAQSPLVMVPAAES